MTAQTPDAINVEGVPLSIQGVRGNALFNPAQLGWKTQMSTTNCWRGFVATYAVNDGRLVLARLAINFAYEALAMKEPIFVVEVRDAEGTLIRHPVFRQSVKLGSGGESDVVLRGESGRNTLTFFGSDFGLESGRRYFTLRDGDEQAIGPYVVRPQIAAGYDALVTAPLPSLHGHAGKWYRAGDSHKALYEDLNVRVEFTGGILCCRGFIRDLGVHMGFHPAWKFEHVEELIFDGGRLIHRDDVSEKLAEVRELLSRQTLRPGPGAAPIDILAWTKRCFELDY